MTRRELMQEGLLPSGDFLQSRRDILFSRACMLRLARRAAALSCGLDTLARDLNERYRTAFEGDHRASGWLKLCLDVRNAVAQVEAMDDRQTWDWIRIRSVSFGTCLGEGLLAEYEAIRTAQHRQAPSMADRDVIYRAGVADGQVAVIAMHRDIFDPSSSESLLPEWRTTTAVAIAQGMYESRDFGPMPLLADALQDAGCEAPEIIDHCRGPGPHVRGCWVVDGVLGKA